jgi:sulfur-oxidizing protein SoxA
MKKHVITAAVALALASAGPAFAKTDPKADLKKFQDYFVKKFPKTPKADFGNGVYSIHANSRKEWMAIEEFPPYEPNIERGKKQWTKPFANGKTLASCFKNGDQLESKAKPGLKQHYPYFDKASGKVRTLEMDINQCLKDNGEKEVGYSKGAIADVMSYVAFHSRGKKINVVVPDDPKAMEAYERGKQHFYAKRGQLNFSCADCHVNYAGGLLRADTLSPALGGAANWPVYRSKWAEVRTLHERYKGCNEMVRAKGFPLGGEEYNALEYFHTYLNNGLPITGPSSRK